MPPRNVKMGDFGAKKCKDFARILKCSAKIGTRFCADLGGDFGAKCGLFFCVFLVFVAPLNAKKSHTNTPKLKSSQTTQDMQATQATHSAQFTHDTQPTHSAQAPTSDLTNNEEINDFDKDVKQADKKTKRTTQKIQNPNPRNEIYEYTEKQVAITKPKNGYFIAVNGGANVRNDYDKYSWIPTFGLTFGVHSFFTPYIGVRGYMSAEVGFGRYEGVLGVVALGFDALAEFSLNRKKTAFLGGILGLGANGYVYYDKRQFSTLKTMDKSGGFFLEIGATLAFLKHNRLNIVGRFIPARRVQDFSNAVVAFGQYSYSF